jgi:hypothetical protein
MSEEDIERMPEFKLKKHHFKDVETPKNKRTRKQEEKAN